MEVGPSAVALSGVLSGNAPARRPPATLIARRRADGREVTAPATLDDGRFSARLELAGLASADAETEVWDLHLELADGRVRLGRWLDGVPDKKRTVVYPSRRLAHDGSERDMQPYFTIADGLSVRSSAVADDGRPAEAAPRVPAGRGALGARALAAGRRLPLPLKRALRRTHRRIRRSLRRTLRRQGVGLARRALLVGYHAGGPPARAIVGGRRRRNADARARSVAPVRVLIVHAYGMGGTIRATMNLVEQLARVHDVELVSLFRRRDEPFFPFPEGIRVRALDDQRAEALPHGLAGAARRVLDRLPSVLIHPEDYAFRSCSLWTDVLLVRWLRSVDAGTLITTRPAFNLLAGRLRPPGATLVGQEHMHFGSHAPALSRAIRREYRHLDSLVVLTQADLDDYRSLLAGAGVHLAQIPNGLPRLEGGLADPRSKVIVGAGRLTRQKGFDMLLRAFAPVAREHPDWQLRIYGSGREQETLQRLIVELDLYDDAFLLGPAARLGDELAKASVFVLSSRFEGFGMVLLEAMSKGLAVATFDCPRGPSDIVSHGRDGLLVPPKDVPALTDAIRRLVEDEDLRRRLAAAGLERSRAYDMARIGESWRGLLGELAGERPLGVPQSAAR